MIIILRHVSLVIEPLIQSETKIYKTYFCFFFSDQHTIPSKKKTKPKSCLKPIIPNTLLNHENHEYWAALLAATADQR